MTSLQSLYSDVTLQVARFLSVPDLVNLSLTCKSLYSILCDPNVQGHWLKHIPSAFLPITQSPNQLPTADTRLPPTSLRRFLSLQKAWTKPGLLRPQGSVEIVGDYWNLHIPGTRWMFTFNKLEDRIDLRCIDLMTGLMAGSLKLTSGIPGTNTLAGHDNRNDGMLISYVTKNTDAENKVSWCIHVLDAKPSTEDDKINVEFVPIKTIEIPTELANNFTSFEVMHMEGDYLALSGNWSSKHFLLVDWSKEIIVLHSCSKLWRTFSWRLFNKQLIIPYDDNQVCSVDIAKRLASASQSGTSTGGEELTLFNVSTKASLVLTKRSEDVDSFRAMVITAPLGFLSYDIQGTQITITPERKVVTQTDALNKLKLRPRFPELYETGLPMHVGSSIVFLDDFALSIYMDNGEGGVCEKSIQPSYPLVGIVEMDESIGMLAVSELDGAGVKYSTRVYWIA